MWARFVATELKLTKRPPGEIASASRPLAPFPSTPAVETLIRAVVWSLVSRTNTSATPFPSPATRFDALETNAT